jgi:hypothetical protein
MASAAAAAAAAGAVLGISIKPQQKTIPMALPNALPPVVIAIPHRGATASTGIEVLGENLDVFAEELPGPSIDHLESTNVLNRQMVVRGTPSSSPSLFKTAVPYESNAIDPNTAPSGWYAGWRIEYACDARELSAIRTIMALPKGSESPLPHFDGVNITSLFQKLYYGCATAATQADRLYSQQLQAYQHDIPQLRQRTINAEQALHEANLRNKSLAEQAQLCSSSSSSSSASPSTQTELEVLRRQRDALVPVLRQVREALVCPICTEVSLLPKVLGPCGHIACQQCLKQLDDVAFATLTSSAGGASARQHLMARRCPLCRTEIVGGGFPVHSLKDVACALVCNGLIEPTDTPAVALSAQSAQKRMEFKSLTFAKETAEAQHIHALQMGCYAQSQMSQHSVTGIIAAVAPEQWIRGVYVLFEAAVSRVFFETFATSMHGKAGGVNVLVNSAQRMLACQLTDRNPQRRPADSHLLVKVATDGRFTIGFTPEPKDAAASDTKMAGVSTAATSGVANSAGFGNGGFVQHVPDSTNRVSYPSEAHIPSETRRPSPPRGAAAAAATAASDPPRGAAAATATAASDLMSDSH